MQVRGVSFSPDIPLVYFVRRTSGEVGKLSRELIFELEALQ